jgi:predicted double-glycine peptidase
MKKYIKFLESLLTPKIKLDFPELRQATSYTCGVTALQQVLIYYGIEKREDELMSLLATKKTSIIEHGTKMSKIVEVAVYFGLEAYILKNSNIKEIKTLIDKGIPPILLIQAWRDYSVDNLDWNKDYKDGHYVVAVGYNDTSLFFEDPSSVNRTYLTFEEFETRWHDASDDNIHKYNHYAVIIKGEKKFSSTNIIHMD